MDTTGTKIKCKTKATIVKPPFNVSLKHNIGFEHLTEENTLNIVKMGMS
jgi:hypothetical protein